LPNYRIDIFLLLVRCGIGGAGLQRLGFLRSQIIVVLM